MIATTEANQENGCLQVMKGSHKMGRVNHALACMEHVYVELEAGDALFFHSNLLHRSEANLSEKPRDGRLFPLPPVIAANLHLKGGHCFCHRCESKEHSHQSNRKALRNDRFFHL